MNFCPVCTLPNMKLYLRGSSSAIQIRFWVTYSENTGLEELHSQQTNNIRPMFLKNTYVYNVDVSPPEGSALEVALVTFAKNLETSLIFIIWNIVRKQGSHGTGLSLSPGSQSTCSMGQSVNQRTENPCL